MKKITILFILPSLAKGGAERLILDICHEFGKKPEFEVKLAILNQIIEYKNLAENIDISFCNSGFIPSILGKSFEDLIDLNALISKFKPDIIHSNLFEAEMTSRRNIFPGIVYISHCHDNMIQFRKLSFKTFFKKKYFTNFYEKLFLLRKYKECNNNFIVISNDSLTYFKKNIPSFKERITIIPNAIDQERFYFSGTKPSLTEKPVRLITTGSLTKKKNQIFLIDVIKILSEKGFDVHLDILGDGTEKGKIKDRIFQLGLEKNIELKGNVENVEEYLKEASIYLHSAIYEPFGLALLEAMATGCPCICLDGKGNRDIIKNGYNGFILDSPNHLEFAEKIIFLITQPHLYNEINKNCLDFSKNFGIKQYADKLSLYYKNLLNSTKSL